jgi:hypothetical protein
MKTTIPVVERKERDPTSPTLDTDRWLPAIPIATLIATFCLLLFCSLPGWLNFILIPIVVLGLPVVAIILFVWTIFLLAKKMWKRAVSVCVATALPVLLFQPIIWAVDFVHLGLTVGLGIGELNNTLPDVDRRFQAHDWSVGLAGGLNTFLLHDETDEIALPPTRHRDHVVPEDSLEKMCAGRVRHIVSHYYVCTFF